MNLQMDTQKGITIIRVQDSRVDAALAPALKKYLQGVIDDGNRVLGMDMSGVRFIDSSGLGVLVTTMKRIGNNGKIGLWGLSKEVKALFELTQLYKVFDIFEVENDALHELERHVLS